jgi:SAM-dependent methyltransferase
VTDDEGYLLANRAPRAGARLDALAELFDPSTFRHLTARGVGPGWRCWEVGAGARSVPDWLAEQVGAGGLVVATDIDTSRLDGPAAPAQLRILCHDVGTEPAPAEGLDLVHARLVLTHVPARDQALATMVAALRPGGWLVVEDADPALQPLLCPDESGPSQRLANRLRHGFRRLMADRGADLAFGRTLPRRLRDHGLQAVGADAWFPLTAPACSTLEITTVEQIRDRLVAAGIATATEIDQHVEDVAAGRVPDLATSPMITAWGLRAGACQTSHGLEGQAAASCRWAQAVVSS